MTFARDIDIGLGGEVAAPVRIKEVDQGVEHLRLQLEAQLGRLNRIVCCPAAPVIIPGIVATNVFDAGDCFGTIITLPVPKSGVLYSATFWDLDNEGTEIDFEIFKHPIAQTASDAAWAPSDADILHLVHHLAFVSFADHSNSQTSEVTNIGKGYTAPRGMFYIQAKCVGTPNIAAANMPRFQFQIIPDDPNWQEK